MAVVEDAVWTNQNDPRGQNDSDLQVVKQQQQKIGSVELQDQSGNGNVESTQKMGLARNMDQVNGNGAKALEKEVRDLEDMLSKLNPMAKEFVSPSFSIASSNYMPVVPPNGMHFGYNAANNFIVHAIPGVANANLNTKKKNGLGQGKRRMNNRTSMAQQEEVIRRTVYVSDIDQEETEERLAALFLTCGQVVDCSI
ncbi:RNA splicing factor [Lithospermum erythrorhizon]|uniref:RNA splicing factor n=1 Tax=Lithospermum erythrorhizon TaxID=34254 RepID=A0AAV3NI00_LITER